MAGEVLKPKAKEQTEEQPDDHERTPVPPRADALPWEEYFMGIAFLTAMRSKDPTRQVGACIVNELNRVIGVGYNGFPSGCPEGCFPWDKTSPHGEEATKYPYVVHAELNAILNKNAESCRGCRLYTTLFPCNECAKVIIQAGIRKVIYASDMHREKLSCRAARRLFAAAEVELLEFASARESLQVALRYVDDGRDGRDGRQAAASSSGASSGASTGESSRASRVEKRTASEPTRFGGPRRWGRCDCGQSCEVDARESSPAASLATRRELAAFASGAGLAAFAALIVLQRAGLLKLGERQSK